MDSKWEKFQETYAASLDIIRPILLQLEREHTVHIYPVTRSLGNPSYKIYDLYASHHHLGIIELNQSRSDRVVMTYIPEQYDDRQVQMGIIPKEVLPLFGRFVLAFRERMKQMGYVRLADIPPQKPKDPS
jgi:hypothetical protein